MKLLPSFSGDDGSFGVGMLPVVGARPGPRLLLVALPPSGSGSRPLPDGVDGLPPWSEPLGASRFPAPGFGTVALAPSPQSLAGEEGVPGDPAGVDPSPSLLLLLLLSVGRLCCSLSWFALSMTDWCFRSNSTSLGLIVGSLSMICTSYTETRRVKRGTERVAEARENGLSLTNMK